MDKLLCFSCSINNLHDSFLDIIGNRHLPCMRLKREKLLLVEDNLDFRLSFLRRISFSNLLFFIESWIINPYFQQEPVCLRLRQRICIMINTTTSKSTNIILQLKNSQSKCKSLIISILNSPYFVIKHILTQ